MSKVEEILEIVEELYEYSILNKNEYVKDKSKQLVRHLVVLAEQNSNQNDDKNYTEEIEKVKRKVPKWIKKTHQANYIILKAYMDLSYCNENTVRVEDLENYSELSEMFLGHYNAMKTISEKNHAKVFEEIDKQVKLWEPVNKFIKNIFECNKNIDKKYQYKFNEIKYMKNNKSGFGLGRLLFDIFKQYLEDNPTKSYSEIQEIFNSLHDRFSSEGNMSKVVFNEDDYQKWYIDKVKDNGRDKRYFEPVNYNDQKLYFTTQWGDTHGNITDYINHAINNFGYDIKSL